MFQKEGINIGAGNDLRWINSLDSVVEAVAGTWHQCETVAKRETVRKGAETKCRAVASEMPLHRTEPVVGSFTKYRGNTVLRMGCISCGALPSYTTIYHKVALISRSPCALQLQTSYMVSPFVLQNNFSRRTSRSSSCWKRRR